MAKKILLKDLNGIELLPITRAKLILDSSGKLAFRSTSLVATEDLPGLMSSDDKKLIKNAIIVLNTINDITTITDINNTTIYPKTIAKAVLIYNTNLEDYLATKLTLDERPTKDSTNGVQSGGVYTEIEKMVGRIYTSLNFDKIGGDDYFIKTIEQTNGLIKADLGGIVNTSQSGLVPKIDVSDLNSVKPIQLNDLILTTTSRYEPTWKKFLVPTYIGADARALTNGIPGLVPECSYKQASMFLRGDGLWAVPTNSHYTTHLYIGAEGTAAKGATTNGNTYIKLYDSSTARESYKIAGSGRVTVTSDTDGNITIGAPTITWEDVTEKPTSFIPARHRHRTDEIILLDEYTPTKIAEKLEIGDPLNTALSKLEFKADTAYSFIAATMSDDPDDTINRLKEVFDVLVGITETDTIQALVGKYLLLEGGTMTGVINSMHILPKTELKYNLGSLNLSYNTLYTRYICTKSGYDLRFMSGDTEHIRIRSADGALIPFENETKDIGTSTYRFKNIYGTLIGNASSATKLQTARKFTIGGVERTFDGSANVTITKSDMGLNNVQNTAFYKRVTTVNGSGWNMAGTVDSVAFSIYAPTSAGTSGQVLTSTASTPKWTDLSDLDVGNASSSSRLKILDLRNTDHLPNSSNYPDKHVTGWFNSTGTPTSTWYSGLTIKGWTNTYQTWLIASGSNTSINEKLYYRCGITNSSGTATWNDWKQIAFTSDFSGLFTSLSLSSGTLTATIGGVTKNVSGLFTALSLANGTLTATIAGVTKNVSLSGLFTALSLSDGTLSATIGGTTKSVTLSVNKLGTSTVGTSGRPIYLNAGTPTAISVSATTDTLYIAGVAGSTGNIRTGTQNANGVRIVGGNKLYAYGGFYESSDNKLKNFKENIEINFEKLKQLPKKYFTWKSDETNKLNIGTSAQELQELYPELVSEDENGLLHVAYDKLSIIALSAIDKLYEEICELKSIINSLQNK